MTIGYSFSKGRNFFSPHIIWISLQVYTQEIYLYMYIYITILERAYMCDSFFHLRLSCVGWATQKREERKRDESSLVDRKMIRVKKCARGMRTYKKKKCVIRCVEINRISYRNIRARILFRLLPIICILRLFSLLTVHNYYMYIYVYVWICIINIYSYRERGQENIFVMAMLFFLFFFL